MNRVNFRVKVDLSKFYNDARRFCWVFVDANKIFLVEHIKQHITKLFSIKEPFHVMLNDTEYLPPMEDIRILKENETILVEPGSGLQTEMEASPNVTILQNEHGSFPRYEKSCNSTQCKETQIFEVPQPKAAATLEEPEFRNNGLSEVQADISSINTTFHSVIEENELESAKESKATDSNVTDDSATIGGSMNQPTKRKRIRRRKPKKQITLTINNNAEDESKSKKPKIINSLIIYSRKHVRFDSGDVEEANETEPTSRSTTRNESYIGESTSTKDLSTLLSLSQSSTPLTFANRRVKEEVKVENVSDEEAKVITSTEMKFEGRTTENLGEKLCIEEAKGYSWRKEPIPVKNSASYPRMIEMPQIGDMIAFKIWRIAQNYSPYMSEYIIAKVISYCSEEEQYTFKILEGIDQFPVSGWELGESGKEILNDDTATLNYAQIKDVLLVSKSHSDNAVVPTCCDA